MNTLLLRTAFLSTSHALYRLAYGVGVATTSVICALLVLFFVARARIRPAPGAWATTVQVGPVSVEVGVASLIWLGTTPWVAQQLQGRTLPSPAGPVRIGWDTKTQALTLHCQPCSLHNASWGTTALRLYLDNAPWGATVCGAQAAAHIYFAKRADQLTTDEAVWLAAMLHNPAMEARRWATTGHINYARAQWVAQGLLATGQRVTIAKRSKYP